MLKTQIDCQKVENHQTASIHFLFYAPSPLLLLTDSSLLPPGSDQPAGEEQRYEA